MKSHGFRRFRRASGRTLLMPFVTPSVLHLDLWIPSAAAAAAPHEERTLSSQASRPRRMPLHFVIVAKIRSPHPRADALHDTLRVNHRRALTVFLSLHAGAVCIVLSPRRAPLDLRWSNACRCRLVVLSLSLSLTLISGSWSVIGYVYTP